MNSRASAALLTVSVLALTLAPKLLMSAPPNDAKAEAQAKFDVLRSFLATNGVRDPVKITPNPGSPDWAGWRVIEPHCSADIFPDIGGGDALQLLKHTQNSESETAFIYRGSIFERYPQFWVARDKAIARLERVVNRPRWEKPLVIDLFYSGDCQSILRWNWSKLWT